MLVPHPSRRRSAILEPFSVATDREGQFCNARYSHLTCCPAANFASLRGGLVPDDTSNLGRVGHELCCGPYFARDSGFPESTDRLG